MEIPMNSSGNPMKTIVKFPMEICGKSNEHDRIYRIIMDNHGSLVSLGDTNLQNVDDKYDKVSLVVEKTPATGWFPHVSPTEIDRLEIFAI